MHPFWFSLSKSLTPNLSQSESISASNPTNPSPGIQSGSSTSPFLSTLSPPTANSIGEGAHDPIPYHQMWEESRVWLPVLLRSVLPAEGDDGGSASASASSTATPDTNTNLPVNVNPASDSTSHKCFIHHVEFVGGVDSDAKEGGEYSVWHGMGNRKLEWVDRLPFEQWEGKQSYGKYP
ncbi:hypothetical protein ABW19_dt0202551 [Dactylella cylindrospora]|nr:hypothetical protein ABW19_dt0202551 [Dactylella cylindrospora]